MTYATYSDLAGFLANGALNVETASVIGGNTALSTAAAIGATTLAVASTAGFPAAGTFSAYVFDGVASETVSASVSGGSLAVAAGTAAAHAAGVNVASGSLADACVRAARLIENYCRQGPDGGADRTLYALSRVENLDGPGWRAAWDTSYNLCLTPRRWPIQSVAQVSIRYGSMAPVTLISGTPIITDSGQGIILPFTNAVLIPSASFLPQPDMRSMWFVAALTYTAGACGSGPLAGVPDDLREAAYLLIADILSRRENPYGLTESQQGKVRRVHRLRTDAWTSMFRERAYELLDQYATDQQTTGTV